MEKKETPKIVQLIEDYSKTRTNLLFKARKDSDLESSKAIVSLIDSTDRVIYHLTEESVLESLIEHVKQDPLLDAVKTVRSNYALNRLFGTKEQALSKHVKQTVALFKKFHE